MAHGTTVRFSISFNFDDILYQAPLQLEVMLDES